ncbi:MAG: four helix bundle protein [Candidatus Scalinduaceae bacterium]
MKVIKQGEEKAREYRKEIWNLCKTLPSDEKYRLTDQMIRASRSVTANIAEGYGRFHYQENIQFCRQSRGSAYEMIDHITVAVDCEYIDNEQEQYYINKVEEIIKLLNGYIKYLKKSKEDG